MGLVAFSEWAKLRFLGDILESESRRVTLS